MEVLCNVDFACNLKYAYQDNSNIYLIMDYMKHSDLTFYIYKESVCYDLNNIRAFKKYILAELINIVGELHKVSFSLFI
jgi:serine/threonine protein kinase